jgi:Leucine-rich repeat (LRR) protein
MPLKILLFLKNNLKTKKPFSKCQRAGNVLAPPMFSSWNQIIQDIRNIYKLKELIKVPARVINNV